MRTKRYIVGMMLWSENFGREYKRAATLREALRLARPLWRRGKPWVRDTVSDYFAWPGMFKRWDTPPCWDRKGRRKWA